LQKPNARRRDKNAVKQTNKSAVFAIDEKLENIENSITLHWLYMHKENMIPYIQEFVV